MTGRILSAFLCCSSCSPPRCSAGSRRGRIPSRCNVPAAAFAFDVRPGATLGAVARDLGAAGVLPHPIALVGARAHARRRPQHQGRQLRDRGGHDAAAAPRQAHARRRHATRDRHRRRHARSRPAARASRERGREEHGARSSRCGTHGEARHAVRRRRRACSFPTRTSSRPEAPTSRSSIARARRWPRGSTPHGQQRATGLAVRHALRGADPCVDRGEGDGQARSTVR